MYLSKKLCLGAVSFAALVVQCGSPNRAASESVGQSSSGPAEKLSPEMSIQGLDLYMHNYAPTEGEARKPTFSVHADSGALTEVDRVWSLVGVRAVVYGKEQELEFAAGKALFDEENQRAELEDSVRLTSGAMEVSTERAKWDNQSQIVTADGQLAMRDGATELTAQSLVLDPNKKTFRITQAEGRASFEQAKS